MVLKRSEGDLCKAYRPQTFSEVVGQKAVVKSLRQSILSEGHSHCFLFYGETGCGKTTLARIVAGALNCNNRSDIGDPCCECESCKNIANKSHMDVHEINASNQNSINDARRISQELKTHPMFGKVKVYIFDEAHKLTSEAQNALLVDTEDMPDGVYIIFCSTEPQKIISTLKNRCESYNFRTLPSEEISTLIKTVGVFEDFYPEPKVLDAIVQASENRPRNALKILQQVLNLYRASENIDPEEVLGFIHLSDEDSKEIADLCRLLYSNKKTTWPFLVSIYKKINAPAEAVQLVLAGWARSVLERAKTPSEADRAAEALSLFIDLLPYTKPENKLVLNLYKAYRLFNDRN